MDYLVTLKFVEPYYTNPGDRVFSASVNGTTNSVLSRIDVLANAGGQFKPWDTTIPVTVSDGQITIQLSAITNYSDINAIEIVPASSVEVLPRTATLAVRQMQQFSALAHGLGDPGVTWSISPANLGTISSAGLYTAPASIPAATTVNIIATSVANTNLFGFAVVSLSPTDPNSFAPIRINAGGPTYTDPAGRVWAADSGSDSCSPTGTGSFVPPVVLDGEYDTYRACYPSLTYRFTVPNMDYLVTLKFVEPYYTNPGDRVFSASVNGTTNNVLNRIDVLANAGGQFKPWDTPPIPVTVSDGQITIQLSAITNYSDISAIEIVPASSVEVYGLPRPSSLPAEWRTRPTPPSRGR
jgi:hypothetical protein